MMAMDTPEQDVFEIYDDIWSNGQTSKVGSYITHMVRDGHESIFIGIYRVWIPIADA
jgi:hypothetical protein